MSQNKTATLTVTTIGAGGDGIASFEGAQAFIPYTVAGDEVEVSLSKKGANWLGQVKQIITPSPNRVEPKCQHYTSCGGCNLQHVSDSAYESWIVDRIKIALSHQQISCDNILKAKLSPKGSRRRLALNAFNAGGKIVLGFNKPKSHQIVDVQECPVARPELVALLPSLRKLLAKLIAPRQGASVQMVYLDGKIGVLLTIPKEPDLEGREQLASFTHDNNIATLSLNVGGFEELVAQNQAITHGFGLPLGGEVPISAFLQATDEGEQALQQAVAEHLEAINAADKPVLDLFSGLGTFSLSMAAKFKTVAVEGELKLVNSQQAIANRNKLVSLEVIHRDLFRRPFNVKELSDFGAVVFDPPRAGAQAQVEQLAMSDVPLVIGVSCNPNTFGRDARVLIDGGYTLKSIQPVDQFLWSHHVELVAVFER